MPDLLSDALRGCLLCFCFFRGRGAGFRGSLSSFPLEKAFQSAANRDQIKCNSNQEAEQQLRQQAPGSGVDVLKHDDEAHENNPFRNPIIGALSF